MSTPPDGPAAVPGWPVIRIALGRDPRSGQPELSVGGVPVEVPTGVNARALAIEMVAEEAQRLGRPVRALAVDEDGSWPLIVHPDGSTGDPPATNAPRRRPTRPVAPAFRARPGRAPAGLIVGVAGLVLLLGLAAGALAVTTTASRTPSTAATGATTPATPPSSPAAPPEPAVPAPTPTSPTPAPPLAAAPPTPRSQPTTHTAPPTRTRAPNSAAPPAAPVVARLTDGLGHCLTGSPDGSAVWAAACDPGNPSQSWTTTAGGALRQGTKCVSTTVTGASVGLMPCAESPAQRWTPASAPGHLINGAAAMCLAELTDGAAAAVRCTPHSPAQAWARKP